MNIMRNSVGQRGRPRLLSRNSSSATASTSNSRTVTTNRAIYPAGPKENPTIFVSLSNSISGIDTPPEEPPRRRGGGRGREWMGRCHRLIQAMLELEESKPFRDPVNELLFPAYSSCVEKHMDLSRVMMNLHSGLYTSPSAFDDDIKLIFSNWKKYNKDPSSMIYSQLYKLSWWYNREFTSLMAEVAEKFSGKSPNAAALRKVNAGIGNSKSQLRKILPASRGSPLAKRKRSNDNEPSNIAAVSLGGDDVSFSAPPASRFAWTTLSGTTPTSVTASQETSLIAKSTSVSMSATPVASTSSKSAASSNNSSVVVIQSSQSSASNSDEILSMELDVTNIWLGSTRVRPSQPVKLSEEGLQIYLAPNSDFSCTSLSIPMKDIVRAVGHLKKSKKHSLFVFVTPSIEKEMRSLFKGNPTNVAKSKIECFSLVTIFVKALSSTQISRLIHIFWNMSRESIFGQLFSETDQMGALSILASIKPNIMHRVAEKHNDTNASDSSAANREANSASKNSPRPANRAMSGSAGLSKQTNSRLANESSSSNSPSVSRTGANQSSTDNVSNRESPTSSSGEAHEDLTASSNGVVVDDGDLEIVDPSESVDDAAMEAMLADEDDLVMMKTVVNTKCPITQLTMTEPVKNKNCGHTYDKQGVQQLIVNRGKKAKCPVPGCSNDTPLEMVDMVKDIEVEHELLKSK